MTACPTGKVRHASLGNAKAGAHLFARQLNAEGKVAEAIYGYRCRECRGGWHLTRREEWDGEPNTLLCPQAPLELQRWAITGVVEVIARPCDCCGLEDECPCDPDEEC